MGRGVTAPGEIPESHNLTIKPKLITLFLLVGLLPLALVAAFSLLRAHRTLTTEAYERLASVHANTEYQLANYFEEQEEDLGLLIEMVGVFYKEGFSKLDAVQSNKKGRLEDYFASNRQVLFLLRDDPNLLQAMLAFNNAFHEAGDRVDTEAWRTLAGEYDAWLRDIAQKNHWADFYLLHNDGDIVYTAGRGTDLGLVIEDSTLATTGLGEVYRKAQTMDADEVAVADFAPYVDGSMSLFMMA